MTARAAVPGERGDAIEMPGAARRAAAYRRIFLLVLVLGGAGSLLVYYWSRHHPQVTQTTRPKGPRVASTEMRLPPLRPAPPVAVDGFVHAAPAAVPGAATGAAAADVPPVPALPNAVALGAPGAAALAGGIPSTASAGQSAGRRGNSPVLLKAVSATEVASVARPVDVATEPRAQGPVKVLHAARLPALRFLLARGSFLDCTLETAIDSTLPGLATCLLSGDVYGADGTVVLLPRGSRLVGDTRSDVRAGQARVGITWTEARTPEGLVLPLGAAATDALGRTGVPGAVDRHTIERFGSAVMLSVIDAATGALMNRRPPGNGIVYNVQGSRDVATEALRQSIHIPPTIRVEPGARVDVIVATDVDFAEVYQLVAHDGG
jgi:type IV secretion system protein VirB10